MFPRLSIVLAKFMTLQNATGKAIALNTMAEIAMMGAIEYKIEQKIAANIQVLMFLVA